MNALILNAVAAAVPQQTPAEIARAYGGKDADGNLIFRVKKNPLGRC